MMNMKIPVSKLWLYLVLCLTPGLCRAQTEIYPAPVAGDFVMRDFKFQSGEILPELKVHYVILGTPTKDKDGRVMNAVLVLHGTGGSHRQFLREQFAGVLFKESGLLDAEKYFIIIPDNIGHGASSKPSDGLHAKFPHYGYHDMVTAQYRLLTEELGVNHLRLVMGTSMGGMHSWMWGEMYPDFMDALMPLASLPVEISGRNRFFRRMIIDPIRNDPDWQNGEYKTQPVRGLTTAIYTLIMMGSAPLYMQSQAPSKDSADKLFDDSIKARLASTDANDLLYQVDASRDYNPAPGLETIKAPLLAINSADDAVNPPELGIVEREIRCVKNGRFVLLPITQETRGHGTHTLAAIWQNYLAELLMASEKKN
ncbi:alpha/beta fold hydrolase [Nitrosomonas sp. Nm33]|uniref:alpha/beta fold hydrolase n=1 Tax=Nitrosomonas sp. Nm33 TaxID=133724 RepID=UPI00089450D9|nr:alpha/beta fold hydrolase [Nitrosomonas sp. Nm33]SDY97104.1 homoserine O-acetyltransferase [Nitrosomonas sp. Nm33]